MNQINFQKFTDGVARIYFVKNIAEKGDKPIDRLTIKRASKFSYKTVGVERYVKYAQIDLLIDTVIIIPQYRAVSTDDVVVIGDVQYRITQVQHIEKYPKISQLSLWKLEESYEFERIS